MTEKEEQNGIINAVTKNDVTLLKNRISNYKSSSIDFVDDNGMTPLQHACYKGNKEAVRLLLDQVLLQFHQPDSIVYLPLRLCFTSSSF